MTTLIAVYDSDGCRGRCDARCYNASGSDCDCVCGGANHGKGLKQAFLNTQSMVSSWLDKYKSEHPEAKEVHPYVRTAPVQLELIPGIEPGREVVTNDHTRN